MQTEREWLVSKGLAKPGRGRYSRQAKEALAQARADGVQFAEAAYVQAAKERAGKPKRHRRTKAEMEAARAAGQAKPKATQTPTPEGQNYTHFELPSGKFKFFIGDKEITERTACANCGVSLVVCHCEVPEVVWVSGRGNLAKVRREVA